jgi:ribokinase
VFDVCVVGSANLDLVATATRLPAPGETVSGTAYAEHAGGKGLNQAVAASRAGAHVAMVGAVGGDDAGRRLLAVLQDDGVDRSQVAIIPDVPSGRALIAVDDNGENTIVVVPGANAAVTVSALPAARVVLVQLEIPAAAVAAALRQGRAAGATTVLNPAPAADLPAHVLAACDIVVPNEHEAASLGGVERLLELGVGAVITTLGSGGIDVVTRDANWHQDPFDVAVVDTTGAGDACCAALAARLAAGDELAGAVRFAAAAGALATTTAGAVPSLPRAEDIERLAAGG